MPSLNTYKRLLGSPSNDGQARKNNSDMIIEYSWNEDIASKEVYIFDYYHDEEPLKYINIHPEKWNYKTKVDIKFIINSYTSENKDIVGKHIMFKPSFRWENISSLSYYYDAFVNKYDAEFPIGMYLAIQDEKGIYRKWLVTEIANSLDLQFPTWYILPCDHLFQWIHEGNKYQMCGVSRSQNSYNSGEWRDYIFTQPENQRKCILPMNDISATMFYNKRIVISAPISHPITWHCSKVEQTSPKGISRITFAQETWDDNNDVFIYANGDITHIYHEDIPIIGMYADYWKNIIEPKDPQQYIKPNIYSVITCSGIKNEIKVGGSYKKLTTTYYNNSDEIIDNYNYDDTKWYFKIKSNDEIIDVPINTTSLISLLPRESSTDLNKNQIKVKFNKEDKYIGCIFIVGYKDHNCSSELELDIVGL